MTAILKVTESIDADYTASFEAIYAEAAGDRTRIPWSDGAANPALVTWLNTQAPSLVRCGSRVAVVGCGLGEDACELIRRGYEVTAFDVSPTAIEWAKRLDAANARCYHRADVLDLPPRWRHRFDLVVEIYTVQSLPISMRQELFSAMTDLLGPHGCLLAICRGTQKPVNPEDGPPWALTEDELLHAASLAGLTAHGGIDSFMDDETPPKRRLRGVFRRAR